MNFAQVEGSDRQFCRLDSSSPYKPGKRSSTAFLCAWNLRSHEVNLHQDRIQLLYWEDGEGVWVNKTLHFQEPHRAPRCAPQLSLLQSCCLSCDPWSILSLWGEWKETDSPCTWSDGANIASFALCQAPCFACSTMTQDKSRLLVGSVSSISQAEVGAISPPLCWAQLAALLPAIALQPQSKKAAGAVWHFYRSPRISTSAGSVSTDRMVYYSRGCSPRCLSCSIKLSCKGRYLPCSHLSRGHFAPMFSDVTDKHSCLKCFRFTAPRYSRYNSYTPINSKCLSITRREMFMPHYARLRAQLLWITRRLLLWAYCNHMWHSPSYFLLPS